MKNSTFTLYLEINDTNYIFYVGANDEQNNYKIIYQLEIPLQGIEDNRVSDLEKVFDTIKKNIFFIEKKIDYTFREIVLILDNFNHTFINLTGYKKLNGSQVLRENITYILNSLKSYIDETELKKIVLHIFNSKFFLDKKETENLPIGLFGDFYCHELSFILINENDYKNLKSIFDRCGINIKKILLKSFVTGADISNNYKDINTFFRIKINENNSKIFYFENNSLKFEQRLKFGTEIIINDISKITSLKKDTIKIILDEIELNEDISENDLIEPEFFNYDSYRKIKKKLIYEIVIARIIEISELMLFKNINFKHSSKICKNIFLEINHKSRFKNLENIFQYIFSRRNILNVSCIRNLSNKSMLNTADKLVHFGWMKEAIPVTKSKKSLIVRFFDSIFG